MKTPRPEGDRAFDARFVAEESSVRRRARAAVRAGSTAPPSKGSAAEATHLGETVGERAARIARKVDLAERILTTLRPGDPRYRMLASAIFRRDEVLLDAVLRAYAQRR